MLRIGDFSRLTRISIRMLRYYDEMGLLKPQHVDERSGHRFYAVEQIKTTHRIQALHDLGLPLKTIQGLLQANAQGEGLATALREREAHLQQELVAVEQRLRALQAHLERLNTAPMSIDVVLKPLHGLTIASIRDVVPTVRDIPFFCEQTLTYLLDWAQAARLPLTGRQLLIYHMDGYVEANFDIEAALVLGMDEPPTVPDLPPLISLARLAPSPLAASVIHEGSLRDIDMAVAQMLLWIADAGYQPSGYFREVHHAIAPGYQAGEAHQGLVELQIPIEPLP